MAGVVAIVGRPNVGKSALFNRMVGRRIAIVHDEPGVTRDRIAAESEWRGHVFTLVDTGGIGLLHREKTGDPIAAAAFEQVTIAIESADVILLVVDAQEGLVPLDREVAARLRRAEKPVLLVANKADNAALEEGVAEFASLGFEPTFGVSALHGRGIELLMQSAVAALPAVPAAPEQGVGEAPPGGALEAPIPEVLKLAVVGRPNVGKSSLINALTASNRVIVSPTPGTTRDAVDVPFEVDTHGVRQRYLLIDTAGIRKDRRVDDSIEFFSVKRAEESIGRCDLVIFVLDAEAGITEQDKKIGDRIIEARKACVLVVNKWDLVAPALEKARALETRRRPPSSRPRAPHRRSTLAEFGAWVQERLFFLDYAPVIFASALSGYHLPRLLEAIRYVSAQLQQKIPTPLLNRTLREAIERRAPPSASGRRLKLFYATQTRMSPPTFLLFVDRVDLLAAAYSRYLIGELRRAFGYEGCPIVLRPRARPRRDLAGSR